MKRAFLFISWLSLIFVPYRAAMAAEASSFESQLLDVHKTILSQAASTHEGFTPQAVISPVSEKEPTIFIKMFVGWSRERIYITDQNLELNTIGNRNWNSGVIVFTGALEATAEPIFPTDSSNGYRLKSMNIDVRIKRAGPMMRGYSIIGYTMTDNTKPIYLTIYLAPTDDGWDISANGLSLHIKDEGYGASIEGRINQNNIGKLELGILGACLGAVRQSPQ